MIKKAFLLFVSSFMLSSCANKMNGSNLSGSGATSAGGASTASGAISAVDLDQVRASVLTAQTAVQGAQTTLGSIFNPTTGAFNWSIFFDGVNFKALDATTQICLANAFPKHNVLALVLTAPSDMATALACILNDVVTVAGIASGDLSTAQSILTAGLAMAIPGSTEAASIESMITEVNTLQTSYQTALKSLASQMTIVTTFLQDLPALTTGAIPIPILSLFFGLGVSDFVNPIVDEILKFQSQLAAL